MTTLVHTKITVQLPDDEAELRAIYAKVGEEVGLDDSFPSFDEQFILDGEFDATEFALAMIDERLVSETAENLITEWDADTEVL